LRLENLKAREHDLLKQIELYDKKIEASRKSLKVEIEKKSIQVKNYSIKHNLSSQYSCSSINNVINYENAHALKGNDQNLHSLDKITTTDEDKYVYPIVTKNFNICDKLICELKERISTKQNKYLNEYNKNCSLKKKDICNVESQLLQSLETNQSHKAVPLHKQPTIVEDNNLIHDIQTEVKNVPLKSQLVNISTLNDHGDNLKEETYSNKIRNVVVLNLENPLPMQCISNQDVSIDLNYLEKNKRIEKSIISNESINDDHSNFNTNVSSSNVSSCQKKRFVNVNENDMNICENKLEVLNNEIEVESMDDYSPDFTSESQESHKNNKKMIDLLNEDQNIESSFEEDRSEGDVIFEDRTFIEQYSSDNDTVSKNNNI